MILEYAQPIGSVVTLRDGASFTVTVHEPVIDLECPNCELTGHHAELDGIGAFGIRWFGLTCENCGFGLFDHAPTEEELAELEAEQVTQ